MLRWQTTGELSQPVSADNRGRTARPPSESQIPLTPPAASPGFIPHLKSAEHQSSSGFGDKMAAGFGALLSSTLWNRGSLPIFNGNRGVEQPGSSSGS